MNFLYIFEVKPLTQLNILLIGFTYVLKLGRLVMNCEKERNLVWSTLECLEVDVMSWKNHENLGKFESKSEEGIFLRYSTKSGAYRVCILSSKCMVESINVIIDDLGSKSRVWWG